MVDRKIYCEVLEGVTFSDRCLFKLSKIIEGNRTCENCILRQLERMKSGKAERSDINDINVTKVTNDIKDIRRKRRRTKLRPKRKPGPIADAPQDAEQPYTVQALIKLIGKPDRTIRKWAEKGKIPAHKVGKKWLFPKEEIDRWLSERGTLNLQCNHTVMTTNGTPQQEGVYPLGQNAGSIPGECSKEENIDEGSS